ncbi:hypothetical protein V5F76_06785 [Xanthobacter agilis]|uniref:DUF397 domain-containing protein n=1 Tax=Xanthobacter agilis TaxID=47492 RepID=A0ABU0LBG1_XANAG|nr:hypothetical protein [Xanthobacter agilis]MDQ0504446.1 hypothetical protein [Xanthobacter agilis]
MADAQLAGFSGERRRADEDECVVAGAVDGVGVDARQINMVSLER